MNTGSMTPARILRQPNDAGLRAAGRRWQGIPAIERSPAGHIFAAWYSGGKTEEIGNIVVVERSDDDGATWTDAWLIIRHDDPMVRCFDPCLWLDPLGRLWLTWTQACGGQFDGRDGVWAVVSDNPDAGVDFGSPRRIANGLMMNKPLVAANGEWLFPCAIWTDRFSAIAGGDRHEELRDEVAANVYVSADQGETFALRGGVVVPDRVFDEHMLIELRDGRLWMLVRTLYGIGQAFSGDGGRTWKDIGPTRHTGPNSRFYTRRLASGRILMINHVNPTNAMNETVWKRRDNLMAMLSEDDGETWIGGLMLDARDKVSYPDATQAEDGSIYMIHDWDRYGAREILMSVFTEEDILAGEIVSPQSRLRVLVNRATGPKAK